MAVQTVDLVRARVDIVRERDRLLDGASTATTAQRDDYRRNRHDPQ
jgi:hypothetical protein